MRWLAFALLLPGIALAQEADTLLGAGLRSRPAYDGSGRRKEDLVPVLRYYGEPWFARTTQGILEGGARIALAKGLAAGAQLGYEAGPRDGDPGASAGFHLEWDARLGPAPVNLLARSRRHLDGERGTQADARLTLGVYAGHGAQAGVFAQATWASASHTQAYYGVREPGLLFTSLGLLGSLELGRRWVLVASVEARRLDGALARSPFVEERASAYASLGLAYRR